MRSVQRKLYICEKLGVIVLLVATTCVLATASCSPRRSDSAAANLWTLRVVAHYTAKQAAPLLACFGQYERLHPNIRIVYQQVSYRDFLQTALIGHAGRSQADIYSLYSIWAPQLINIGALDPAPADVARFVRTQYTPAAVTAATVHHKLYGVPSAVSVYQLVYNRRLLAQSGFDAPPRTWADLERIGAAVTRRNRQGNITVAGYTFGPSVANVTHVFYAQMDAAGTPAYRADGRTTNLRSPTAIKVLSQQVDLFRHGITAGSVSVRDFTGGSAGMATLANWEKEALHTAFGQHFGHDVGVAPIPTDGPGGTMIYSFFWGVDAASPARRQAWNLVRWLNDARGPGGLSCTGALLAKMGDLTGNRGDLVAMAPLLADRFSRGYVRALLAPGAWPQANLWHAEEIDRVLKYRIERAWTGQDTPERALATADLEIRAILAEQPR